MRLDTDRFMLLRLFIRIFAVSIGVTENYSFKSRQVDIFIRVISKRNWLSSFSTHAHFCYFFLFMSIFVVRSWQSISDIVQIFSSSDCFEQLVMFRRF